MMLYLGIDQHARQITISLRDEGGDVVMARQVSTRPEKIQEFFERLRRERLQSGEALVADASNSLSARTPIPRHAARKTWSACQKLNASVTSTGLPSKCRTEAG